MKNWRAYGGNGVAFQAKGTASVPETLLRALKNWMFTEGKVTFPHGQ